MNKKIIKNQKLVLIALNLCNKIVHIIILLTPVPYVYCQHFSSTQCPLQWSSIDCPLPSLTLT